MELLNTLSPEAQLISRCAQVEPSPVAQEDVQRLLRHNLAWPVLMEQVQRHGIEPLVHRRLSAYSHHVPGDVLNTLEQRARAIAFNNLRQFQELLRLVQRLEAAQCPVIPFKGPMLAAEAYGNVAFRRFVDLDVFVRREDILRVKDLLCSQGYEPAKQMDDADEQAYIDSQLGYEFVHPQKQTVVEVHWSFFFEIYAFGLAPEDAWERHRRIAHSGVEVRTFAPEDLLIYLCAHGTKHRWSRLNWIADVGEFVRTHAELDWSIVRARAEQIGGRRMVHLGLLLAAVLLDAPVPEAELAAAQRDRTVRAMARQVCTEWLFRDPAAGPTPPFEVFWFHLKERERWSDRWPYVRHHLQLWIDGVRNRLRANLPSHPHDPAEIAA